MKNSMLVKLMPLSALVLAAVLFSPIAEAEKKEAAAAEPTAKLTICDFEKNTTSFDGGDFVAEHLTAGEKMRCKLAADGGVTRLSKKKSDWSKYNYLVFNVFLEGKTPWSGMFLIGDIESYKKWGQNYVENTVTIKPGENKNFHIGIEGLFCTYANRPLDMSNMQIVRILGVKEPFYFGNWYLVKEEE